MNAHDRTWRLLNAPVVPTLLRLAAPNLGEAGARVAFIAADAVFVGWLGTDALAGVSLAFPIFLVIQMASASGIGAGVASAVARALGGGRQRDASLLAAQSVMLALGLGIATTAPMLAAGPAIYRAMGATGTALDAAVSYSAVIFGGIAAVWLMNTLANVVRGTGVMTVPAAAVVIGEAVHLGLSPALILGLGPFPRLGVVGGGLAVIGCYVAGTLVLLAWLLGGRGLVRLAPEGFAPRRRLLADILKVGGPAGLGILQWQIATVAATGLIAGFGSAALAGYGAATRLELLQMPLSFALGTAVITLVATATGAGDHGRAALVARAGTLVVTLIGCLFGLVATLLPAGWIGMFSHDPAVVAEGAAYLQAVGWSYPLLGIGLGLTFAAQGAGRALGPFLAGTARLVVIAGGGWIVASLGGGFTGMALAIAGGTAVYAGWMAAVRRVSG